MSRRRQQRSRAERAAERAATRERNRRHRARVAAGLISARADVDVEDVAAAMRAMGRITLAEANDRNAIERAFARYIAEHVAELAQSSDD